MKIFIKKFLKHLIGKKLLNKIFYENVPTLKSKDFKKWWVSYRDKKDIDDDLSPRKREAGICCGTLLNYVQQKPRYENLIQDQEGVRGFAFYVFPYTAGQIRKVAGNDRQLE